MSPDTLAIVAVGVVLIVANLMMIAYIIGRDAGEVRRDNRSTSKRRICQARCPHNTFS